jgi:peptidase M23-like protein
MVFRVRTLVVGAGLLLSGLVGWYLYGYLFDKKVPVLSIAGVEQEAYYCGDVQCFVTSNKSGDISIWLDGAPLAVNFPIRSGNQEHPFIIPTKTIANGKHDLKIEMVDNTFNKNKKTEERTFYVDNIPLQAAFVKTDNDKVLQGRTFHLQFQVNKEEIKEAKVQAFSQWYHCFPESKSSPIYECYIPISCEEVPSEYLLTVELRDHVNNELHLETKFQVVLFPFKKQLLQVSKDKLDEEKRLADDMSNLEELLASLVAKSPHEKLWRGNFCTPIDISRISCEFGTVRTTQEKGRYVHKAVDVINMPKSVVWSTQDGVVVVKQRFANSGNTVIVDHGWGVFSLFFHLDNFADINVGKKIAKGNPIGTLGKTGYATGYHLHWEMRINNIPVDPLQWTKSNF